MTSLKLGKYYKGSQVEAFGADPSHHDFLGAAYQDLVSNILTLYMIEFFIIMIALDFLFLLDAAYHDSAASASTLKAFKILPQHFLEITMMTIWLMRYFN